MKYTELLAGGTSKQNKPHLAHRFPRNTSNLQTWFELMDEHVFVEGILYLTCSEDAMMVRISRAHHIIPLTIISQSPPQPHTLYRTGTGLIALSVASWRGERQVEGQMTIRKH